MFISTRKMWNNCMQDMKQLYEECVIKQKTGFSTCAYYRLEIGYLFKNRYLILYCDINLIKISLFNLKKKMNIRFNAPDAINLCTSFQKAFTEVHIQANSSI